MATRNLNLENLTLEQVKTVSERYLMGWHDLLAEGHGFRIKGLNRKRAEFGLPVLTKDASFVYRINYIREHYSVDEIRDGIASYLSIVRVGDARWEGIYLFDCRFGRDYVKAFRELLGSSEYRKVSEECRVQKLAETQNELYGGVGLANEAAKAAAHRTVQERYGVDNPMQDDGVKARLAAANAVKYGGASPFCDVDVQAKAARSKWQNVQDKLKSLSGSEQVCEKLLKSRYESLVFFELVSRFGRDDVLYEYGIHPSDARYPHNCDFYIKSLDLFIEMNCHYSHGNHWFDANNPSDQNRRSQLLQSASHKSRSSVKTWCDTDLKKRADAKASGIRYLVFWDGRTSSKNSGNVPILSDFYDWFLNYDCDYAAFIAAHPENTY